MVRTVDNCSLIKVNIEAGRSKPEVNDKGKCCGYMRRGKIHQVCKKCKLLLKTD